MAVSADSDQDYVENWLGSHEEFTLRFIESWLRDHPDKAKKICQSLNYCSSTHALSNSFGVNFPESRILKHYISTPNLPNQRRRKTATELRKMDKHHLFVELLADVVSPNFDVNHLSHKILVNVLLLTNADRSSLFLVEGSEDSPILVSRLFDVMENTSVEEAVHDESEAIKMPVGVGIAGSVAKTGDTINLQNAYQDPRFNPKIDRETGYQTKSILCMPIKTPDGQVIGVAQVINKDGGKGVFTKEDEEEFNTFLTFCALGLVNSQLLDQSLSLSRRLQVLLQLARDLFEDTTNLEVMMKKVMVESMELIPSERCSVLLIDEDQSEKVSFSKAFQVDHPKSLMASQTSIKSQDSQTITDVEVAERVARTSKPIISNRIDGDTGSAVHVQLDKETQSILCVPICNSKGKTIGIAMLTNKLSGVPFNQQDLESFEVFATFCGLGLHNVIAYEKVFIANARQKIAFEVLSYHASSSLDDTNRLMLIPVPEANQYCLTSFMFDDLPLNDDHTALASVRMFIDGGLVEKFKMDSKTLYRWVLTVKKNYRPVTYHNWRHAFNVAQTMFAMFTDGSISSTMNELEMLALIIGCFCHDLDHRGTNNTFQIKSDSPIAQLYSTSTMEHHHFDHCIMILNSEGNQILSGLSAKQYTEVIKMLESAILSTDLALYFKKKVHFQELVKNHNFCWTDTTHRDLLRGMLMTACDVAAIAKPWTIQQRVAELVASEFFEQGDLERNDLNVEPIAMMDRRKRDELPKMQVGFIDFICLPLYDVLAELLPGLNPLLNGVKYNRENWQALHENPNGPVPHTAEDSLLITPLPLTQDDRNHHSPSRAPIEAWRSDADQVVKKTTRGSKTCAANKSWKRSCSIC